MNGVQRSVELIRVYGMKDGKKVTLLFLESDVRLLTDVSKTLIKISIEEH